MSAEEHVQEADRVSYALVEERRAALFGEQSEFTIDPPADSLREQISRGEVDELHELDLPTALSIAAENNRDYQSRKESLYLAALDVTVERWRLGWIPSAGAGAGLDGSGSTSTSTSADADAGLTRVLGSGARILSGIGLSVFKDLTGGGGWNTTSSFSFLFTQPLLRGAGELIVNEPLTQAERNLVYEVRSFERFRRELAVDIAAELLRIQEDLDAIENEGNNYENVRRIRERNEALATAGRLSSLQVDQALQNELSAKNRMIVAVQQAERALDDFKFFLGLPSETVLSVDANVLENIADVRLNEEVITAERAIDLAHQHRPDFMTQVDRVIDAERRSRVAADALRIGLDISASVDGLSESNKPVRYNFNDVAWGIGLSLDLPIDRVSERRSYRSALISWQASARNAAEFEDRMGNNLREQLRTVVARRESQAIQEEAVELAVKRVESASLNLQAGRASTRDLLEAQDSLVSSRNALNRAGIDYALARLTLVLDTGLLRIDSTGIRVEESLLNNAETLTP